MTRDAERYGDGPAPVIGMPGRRRQKALTFVDAAFPAVEGGHVRR